MKRAATSSAPPASKRVKVEHAEASRKAEAKAKAAAKKAAPADDESSGTESDEVEENAEDSGTESDELDLTRQDDAAEDDDEDDEDGGDADDDGLVHIDFSFNDPRPIDYKSVRRLLARYLPGEEERFPVGEMADALIAQVAVGTMVKVNDDLDVYAFATVMPVSLYKDTTWMKDIRNYLVRHCKDQKLAVRLMALFDGNAAASASASAAEGEEAEEEGAAAASSAAASSAGGGPSKLGLLLNERVLNMPPELAPNIHECLSEDLSWARTNAPESVRGAFNRCDRLLLVAPCWSERVAPEVIAAHSAKLKDAAASAARFSGQAGKKGKAGKGGHGGHGAAAADSSEAGSGSSGAADAQGLLTHFYHFEEELLLAHAELTFTFNVAQSDNEQAAAAAATGGAGSSAGAASSSRKRGGGGGGGGSADDDEEEEHGAGASRKAARGPDTRRVIVLPASKYRDCVTAMHHLVALAGGAGSSAAAAAATVATSNRSSSSSSSGGASGSGSGSGSGSKPSKQAAKGKAK